LAIRFAIETLPLFSMAAVRFTVAGGILYAIARPRSERPTKLNWISAGVVGTLLLAGGNGGVVWAEQWVPSGLAALIVATVPLWMVLFDWLFAGGARPSWAHPSRVPPARSTRGRRRFRGPRSSRPQCR
jgi:drug/metabolite transporter (DMT)-like permease